MAEEELQLIWEDVVELIGLNPLAAEQLKGIALRRRLTEVESKLAALAPVEDGDQPDTPETHPDG